MIAMVAQVMKLVNPGGFAYDALLIATGVIMQFALAYFIEWLSGHRLVRKEGSGAQPIAARTVAAAIACRGDALEQYARILLWRCDRNRLVRCVVGMNDAQTVSPCGP